MKKRIIWAFISSIFLISLVLAQSCELEVALINQDPYPAIPEDYVEVVFQINGISNPECGVVTFEVKEDYPFSLDKTEANPITINTGAYQSGYSSFYISPYKIRIDKEALDGNNPLEVGYRYSSAISKAEVLKAFDINIQDSRADFEIFVKDYELSTNTMTFELLNIEENDIEALTIEIPKQENINVKGPNINIVGDLDSNEFTTADFEATSEGGEITLNIKYTDSINVRRALTKTVNFDPGYFKDRAADQTSVSPVTIAVIVVVILLIIWWIYRRYKKKKHRQMHKHH
jgi:hypothetical protein